MPSAPAAQRGLTLLELVVACGAAALLAAMALPPLLQPLHQARRSDAIAALTRLQAAQEGYRQAHGHYADSLAALRQASLSADGRWQLEVTALSGPEAAYRARALPSGTPWHGGDRECPELALTVVAGFATPGPSPRCWNR